MAIRKVALMGHPVLRRIAAEVPPEAIAGADLQRLIDDLVETMREYEGSGIAAPQVHEPVRICVVEGAQGSEGGPPGRPLLVLVNPKITPLTDETVSFWEGCLSVPDVRGLVSRHAKVRVEALDRGGRPIAFEVDDFLSTVVQHEVDHLEGILFVERAEPRSLSFTRELRRHADDEEPS